MSMNDIDTTKPLSKINKTEAKRLDLLNKIREHPLVGDEYDPVVAMAAIANDPSTPLPLRLKAHSEVAQYLRPKLKAVEIEAHVDTTPGVLRVPSPPNDAAWEQDAVSNAAATAAVLSKVIEGEVVDE